MKRAADAKLTKAISKVYSAIGETLIQVISYRSGTRDPLLSLVKLGRVANAASTTRPGGRCKRLWDRPFALPHARSPASTASRASVIAPTGAITPVHQRPPLRYATCRGKQSRRWVSPATVEGAK